MVDQGGVHTRPRTNVKKRPDFSSCGQVGSVRASRAEPKSAWRNNNWGGGNRKM